ncbi:MAG TPA: thiamine pyrophosphate-dependent enzyme [Symbiobacteriaceae bacterium]|jgi:acetolactate synthase-1/2/3 large subunit
MEMSVAAAVFKALEAEGVEVIFGIPGGQNLPLYDALVDAPQIRHILTRHEQGAIHAAQGYARATGKVGVVMVTSGPGATNLITGLTDAMMDSTPVVAITGQVSRALIGRDAFQEADIIGMTMPVTKHNFQVQRPEELPGVMKQAFYIARTGRPGPVLVDIPRDVANSIISFHYPTEVSLPGYRPNREINLLEVERAVEALRRAERPVAVVGGGVMSAPDAPARMRQLAEKLQIPTAQTLMGLGAFPATHPLSVGLVGMHGAFAANRAVANADVVLAIGVRFADRVTGEKAKFAPNARIIHVDIDPAEVSKNIPSHLPIIGDCAGALAAILERLGDFQAGDRSDWLRQIAADQAQHPFWGERPQRDDAGKLVQPVLAEPGAPVPGQRPEDPPKPQQVLQVVQEVFGTSVVIATDVGQHQMFAAHYLKRDEPRTWLSSCGLGTMGFGLPAAMGAAAALNRSRQVVLITGDGSLQMTMQELGTISAEGLPVKIVLLNNGYLGLVRQLQEFFHGGRYNAVDIRQGAPDFVKMANAYGIDALRVDQLQNVRQALETLRDHDGPMLLDFRTTEGENVFPIVPPGAANTEPIHR